MSESLLVLEVPGRPRPQGSLRMVTNRATGRVFGRYADTTVEHRNRMIGLASDAWGGHPAAGGPVAVRCTFEFRRPASHYGTGKNAGQLKPKAPHWFAITPDVDKLLRLVCDALSIAGVLDDDRQVAVVRGEKRWGTNDSTLVEVVRL